MTLRFDHLVIAVRDLEASMAAFQAIGFDGREGGRHPGFGTRNAIVRFGLDYLELATVDDEPMALRTSRGALVRFLADHDVGLCAYALATDDLDGLVDRGRQAGLLLEGPFAMHRARPDGSVLSWRLAVPGGGQYFQPWPFFIQWDRPDDERLALEQPGTHANGTIGVADIEVGVQDMETAARWHAAMGLDLSQAWRGFQCRLTPVDHGERQGLVSVTLRVNDIDATRACLLGRGLRCEVDGQQPRVLRLLDGPLPGALSFTSE
jgi:glyoxalase-like protein